MIARADNEMHSEVGITYAALVWIEVGSSEQCTIERSMYVCMPLNVVGMIYSGMGKVLVGMWYIH